MLELTDLVQSALRNSGHFNGLWRDMGAETTVIRDAKGDGAIIGRIRKEGAMVRWSINQHLLGEIIFAMRK